MPSSVKNIIFWGLFWYDYSKSLVLKLINYGNNSYYTVNYSPDFMQ